MFLCLDYGDRYIGMAATDTDGRLPHRFGTIDQQKEKALDKIEDIIKKAPVRHILVGVPISLVGNVTDQTRKTLAFIDLLKSRLGNQVKIETIDETLTSIEAQKLIRLEGGNPEDEHAEAARIMLADYIAGHPKNS